MPRPNQHSGLGGDGQNRNRSTSPTALSRKSASGPNPAARMASRLTNSTWNLGFSSTEPIVFFPAIHVTNSFKFFLLGQRHFIESVFYLTHRLRTRLDGAMHLLDRTPSHRSPSSFGG